MAVKGIRPETQEKAAAFDFWHKNDRDFRKLSEKTGKSSSVLYGWAERYNWWSRSIDIVEKAKAKNEPKAVNDTAKFLMDQQQAGALMRMLGVKHLTALGKEQKPFENTGRAIAAIKTGIDIERQAIGLPSIVATILNTNNVDELNSVIRALTAPEATIDGDSTLADTGDNES